VRQPIERRGEASERLVLLADGRIAYRKRDQNEELPEYGPRRHTNHGYGSVPFIVHSFDGVCKSSQGELGTYDSTVDNPVSSQLDRKGYKTDIYGQYGSSLRGTLAIRHVVGGEEVAILSGVHAFSHYTGTSTLTQLTYNGAVFYEQKWVDISHTGIGRDYSYASQTTDPMIAHLNSALVRFWQGSPP